MKLELMNATNFNNNAKHIDILDLKISKKNSHHKSVLSNNNKEDIKKINNHSHQSFKLSSENLNNYDNLVDHSVNEKHKKKSNNHSYLNFQKKKSHQNNKIPNNKIKIVTHQIQI